ncbi:MAG: DUF5777 family beta-barrel protein [Bacteroidota bacterium]
MKKASLLGLVFLCIFPSLSFAQESPFVQGIFRGSRVINGHSLETLRAGEFEFLISHRFGTVNGGARELWGLDQATMRLGFDYGFTDWLTIGVGRSTFEKTYDGFLKFRLLKQKEGSFPISISGFSSIALRSAEDLDPIRGEFFTNRLFYTYQILIGRKFSERFSIQLMPSMVHRNYVATLEESNDVFALGIAGRVRVTKNFSLTGEYYYPFEGQLATGFHPSLSLGFEIETNGHVFQIHLSNSRGMVEKFFIAETTGTWGNGDIHLGFNMARIFKLKGRWY